MANMKNEFEIARSEALESIEDALTSFAQLRRMILAMSTLKGTSDSIVTVLNTLNYLEFSTAALMRNKELQWLAEYTINKDGKTMLKMPRE